MKRILYYCVLFIQATVILLLAVQHMLIDDYGKEIKLLQDKSIHTDNYVEPNYLYIDYEINTISNEVWDIERDLDWREKVYVVLQPNESEAGIYEPVRVTDEKPQTRANEVVLLGRYNFSNQAKRNHYVEYDIERIDNYKGQYQLSSNKRWVVTVKVAPWGQKAIVGMEEE